MSTENEDTSHRAQQENGKTVNRNVSFSDHLSGDLSDECEEEEVYRGRISNLYLIGLVVSILLHILDMGTDAYLAYRYYQVNEIDSFILTTCFIVFPAFINSLISTRMYFADKQFVSSSKWIFRSLVLGLLFAPLLRYIDAFRYGIQLRRSKQEDSIKLEKYYKPLLKEDSNLALLRVIECFLEAAPQQVLQLATLLQLRESGGAFLQVYQYMAILSSLFSIAWSFAIYNRSIRFAREDKKKINWTSSIVQFSWLFLITTSRILALSEVASVFPRSTFVACAIHWIVMTMWLSIYERTWFCSSTTDHTTNTWRQTMEVLFCSVLGLVYMFAFLTTRDGHTRNKYIFYYGICFVENCIATLLWSVWCRPEVKDSSWFVPVLVITVVIFFVGIVLMVLYYSTYHPQIGSMNRTKSKPEIPMDYELKEHGTSTKSVQTEKPIRNFED